MYVCAYVRAHFRGFFLRTYTFAPSSTGKALGFLYVKPTEKAGNSPVDAVYPASSTVHYSSQPINLMQVVLSECKESVQHTNSTHGHSQYPTHSMGVGQGTGSNKRLFTPDG